MAEQFGVDGALGDGAAVYRQVLVSLSCAVVVDDAGEYLLAHAVLSHDEHREVHRRNLERDGQGMVQPLVVAHDAVALLDALKGSAVHGVKVQGMTAGNALAARLRSARVEAVWGQRYNFSAKCSRHSPHKDGGTTTFARTFRSEAVPRDVFLTTFAPAGSMLPSLCLILEKTASLS